MPEQRHFTTRRGFIAALGFGAVSLYGAWAAYGAAPLPFGGHQDAAKPEAGGHGDHGDHGAQEAPAEAGEHGGTARPRAWRRRSSGSSTTSSSRNTPSKTAAWIRTRTRTPMGTVTRRHRP